MRSAHTVEQVRAAEAALMARLPEGTLMQRAATGLAVAISNFLGGTYGARVVLLIGSGDNGGDALYAGAQPGPPRRPGHRRPPVGQGTRSRPRRPQNSGRPSHPHHVRDHGGRGHQRRRERDRWC